MGRTGKILLLVFAALAGFALSFYVFFPLDGAVRTLWRDAARRAAAEGFVLDSSGIETKRFPLSAAFLNLRVTSPLLSAEAGRAEFAPSLLSSLKNLSPAGRLRLERVTIVLPLPGESPIFLSALEGVLTARKEGLEGEILKSEGTLKYPGTPPSPPERGGSKRLISSFRGPAALFSNPLRPSSG
ncbi:hypothetical protein MASR2M79_01530 [Aminivibrio sp.]